MRVAVMLPALLGALASQAGALQPATGACSLLTKEVLLPVTLLEKQARDLAFRMPPDEEAVGKSGSMCSYADVLLQVDPFANPQALETDLARQWGARPFQGLGDVAYFRDNRGEWAELYVRAGRRVITIQMDIPAGRTAESIRPNVIALAKALLPKLK